jgi:hypothetical protein
MIDLLVERYGVDPNGAGEYDGGLPSTGQRSMAACAPSSTWSRSTMSTFTRDRRTLPRSEQARPAHRRKAGREQATQVRSRDAKKKMKMKMKKGWGCSCGVDGSCAPVTPPRGSDPTRW